MKNKGYADFLFGGGGGRGANEMHYGRCTSGKLCTNNLSHKQRTLKTLKSKEQMAPLIALNKCKAGHWGGTGGHQRD